MENRKRKYMMKNIPCGFNGYQMDLNNLKWNKMVQMLGNGPKRSKWS